MIYYNTKINYNDISLINTFRDIELQRYKYKIKQQLLLKLLIHLHNT